MSIYDCVKAHCIVKACFDMSGSVRCSTVEIADTDCDRLSAAFEVWSNRCGEYTELILVRWLNTDNSVASEHVRTYI